MSRRRILRVVVAGTLAVLAVAAAVALTSQPASATGCGSSGLAGGQYGPPCPHLLDGPPTETVVPMGPCVNPNVGGGQWSVPAGVPFSARIGGWITGTPGLVRSFIPKDASTVVVERPPGSTAVPSPHRYQAPSLLDNGLWIVWRWSDTFELGIGEQLRLTLTEALAQPAADIVPPSSTWDPSTDPSVPPWDGTGLKYNGGVIQPFSFPPRSCTITGT